MDKKQRLERLFSLSQLASGLTMLYAFLEDGVVLDDLPDELREDTESLYKSLFKSLEQLGEKFSAYADTAINDIMRTDKPQE